MAWKRASEAGSALMLAPAGLLILLLLASVSVDSALAFLARRQLENEVTAAANDAATLAIPRDSSASGLQAGDGARPDPAAVQDVANRKVSHPYSGGLTLSSVDTVVTGDTITVTATGSVRYIFRGVMPGARRAATVKATASAELRYN
jgi:Flp pilus assembly protein TadG